MLGVGALTVVEARKRLKEADFTFDGKVFNEEAEWEREEAKDQIRERE